MAALQTFAVVGDGVLVFDVYGEGGASPDVPAGSGDPFVNFTIYNSPQSNYFVFNVYGSAGEVQAATVVSSVTGDGAPQSWRDFVTAEFKRNNLLKYLQKEEKKLERVEKQIVKAKVQISSGQKTEGILANLFTLEMKKVDLENKLEALRVEMIPIERFMEAEIDDDDEEVMLLQ